MPRPSLLSTLGLAKILAVAGLAAAAHAQDDGFPPFAFPVEETTFSNGDVRFSAALLKPEGKGPFPAVVLVHGAGQATYDEPALRIHANAFVAVLSYDKRGSGNSTGDLSVADYDDLAADLAAGIEFLRSRRDVRPDQVGVLGRSEGAWVGSIAANRDPRIAFVIMSSGSGVRPSAQTLFATAEALRSLGASPEEVEAASQAKADQWAFYKRVAETGAAAEQSAELETARASVEERLHSFARFAPYVPQIVRSPASSPLAYFTAFTNMIDYDPEPAFRGARAPLLEVIGADDEVVDPKSTIAFLEKLRQSGRDVTVRTLPEVGHSLVVETDQGQRYPEDYPEFAVRWARKQVERAKQ